MQGLSGPGGLSVSIYAATVDSSMLLSGLSGLSGIIPGKSALALWLS